MGSNESKLQQEKLERERLQQEKLTQERYNKALQDRDDALKEERKLELELQKLTLKMGKASIVIETPAVSKEGTLVGKPFMRYEGPADGMKYAKKMWDSVKPEERRPVQQGVLKELEGPD